MLVLGAILRVHYPLIEVILEIDDPCKLRKLEIRYKNEGRIFGMKKRKTNLFWPRKHNIYRLKNFQYATLHTWNNYFGEEHHNVETKESKKCSDKSYW